MSCASSDPASMPEPWSHDVLVHMDTLEKEVLLENILFPGQCLAFD
jgi:hypothetical protein